MSAGKMCGSPDCQNYAVGSFSLTGGGWDAEIPFCRQHRIIQKRAAEKIQQVAKENGAVVAITEYREVGNQ